MMAKRVLWLDIIRVLAAFMVVFIHSPKVIEGMSSNIFYAMYNYIMLPCVPLFFILSGYLLLPIKDNMFSFYKKRMVRICCPLFFWSVVILLITYKNWVEFLQGICYIPFCQKANGHYWFLYSLISVYLFLPIVSVWLKSAKQKEIQFMLYLWILVSVMPYVNIILPKVFDGEGNYSNILYYNAGFLGYFLLGYYLKNYSDKVSLFKSFILMMFTSCFSLFLIILNKRNVLEIPLMNPYLQTDVIFQSIFIFIFIQKVGNKLCFMENIIKFLAPLTFGLYLVHGLILKYITFPLIYDYLKLLPVLAVPVCAVLTFVIGICIVYIISKLPKSKYIIG